jgi:hypothetical protein
LVNNEWTTEVKARKAQKFEVCVFLERLGAEEDDRLLSQPGEEAFGAVGQCGAHHDGAWRMAQANFVFLFSLPVLLATVMSLSPEPGQDPTVAF